MVVLNKLRLVKFHVKINICMQRALQLRFKQTMATATTTTPSLRPFEAPINRGMTVLDRSKFNLSVPLVAAKLKYPKYISELGKNCRHDLLNLHAISRVIKWNAGTPSEEKGILLRHDLTDVESVPQVLAETTLSVLEKAGASYVPYTLELDYDYWKSEEVLAAILPESLLDEIPTGFTVVGHIAHLNLRDEYLPYKAIIGQIILDKNAPLVKTVVNKLDSIHAVYRTFDMEVIAGENDNFEVEQSESGCRFQFNFKQVYWNSRLHTEHARLVSLFQKGEAVCDVFGGVGPFAIPAGKKGVVVLANDLNPNSYDSLVKNIALNKVQNTVFPYNEDGREFIKNSAKTIIEFHNNNPAIELRTKRPRHSKSQDVAKPEPSPLAVPTVFSHYVMNLPDSALTFLDAFRGLYSDEKVRQEAFGTTTPSPQAYPLIHVHCFHKHEPTVAEPTPEQVHQDLNSTINSIMKAHIPVQDMLFHKVRKVAPTKVMYCVSLRLPDYVATA